MIEEKYSDVIEAIVSEKVKPVTKHKNINQAISGGDVVILEITKKYRISPEYAKEFRQKYFSKKGTT